MNKHKHKHKHKQFHFIAVLLLAFALSQSLAPVSHAQSDEVTGDSGSDEVDTGTETDGSGSDTIVGGSDDADPGTPATTTGLGATGFRVFQAAGPTAASIQSTVDAFRAAFGGLNNGDTPGPLLSGRREINWDGGGADSTTLPVTPFNVFITIRGAQFTTPGKGGLTQAPPAGGPQGGLAVLFNNPSYGSIFGTFSPLRLFTPVGSNITDGRFFIPGTGGGGKLRRW
jgi:hypothetical protein